MQKTLMKLEISGIFFILIMSVFMQNLYSISDRGLIGVLFGSVNDSIWETAKTLLFPYVMWGMIELLCFRSPFRKFVVSKVISLYYLGISYIILNLIFSLFGFKNDFLINFTSAIFCISTSLFLSYKLIFSKFELENLFLPAIFMLMLFLAFYFSLTPFPPKMYIFKDRATSLYGIIPKNIDAGAIVLDAMYYV